MPRPRQYKNVAEKQAAYRARETDRRGELRGKLFELERSVWAAADRGDELGKAVASTSIEGMLERLAAAFDARP
jgi:hypothetical protein